ncbi:hypothetical protein BHE74_00028622 [Ensete ventricosum]|nr:hypothetical protein GW17_00015513 [Ensete ventricosum]RWW64166.1 hypothetical protein BHE74_00028622 [Ensete ventricosum]RZR96016.1 hypothetical protein BHM03_00024934 [Ensete ventricosum]
MTAAYLHDMANTIIRIIVGVNSLYGTSCICGAVLERITAHPNFFLLATMNPGGDYGKKELSPALRNRFTEIWVPPVSDIKELAILIIWPKDIVLKGKI